MVPFKCNLQRYDEEGDGGSEYEAKVDAATGVILCHPVQRTSSSSATKEPTGFFADSSTQSSLKISQTFAANINSIRLGSGARFGLGGALQVESS
jgi:hypothetical protein